MKREYLGSLARLLVFLIPFLALAVLVIGLDRPYWGDEAHFVQTIRQFGERVDVHALEKYEEMSTPLPFVAYALWGRVFGFETATLRVLSLIVALATYLSFHFLAFSVLRDSRMALLATVFLALHPYMIGLSLFVFTDMLGILFVILCCLSVARGSPALLVVSSTAGLLCRQYSVFVTAAVALFYLFRLVQLGDRKARAMLAAALVSLVPVAGLFWLWGGPCPANDLRRLYLTGPFTFHPSFLALYVSQFFVYLFPLVLLCGKRFYGDPRVWLAAGGIAWVYWLFPIGPSQPALAAGRDTVGFFHRLVQWAVGVQAAQLVLFTAFLLGLPVVLAFVRSVYTKWRSKEADIGFFLDLAILAFLLVMPFSYLVWEKYFLLVLPLATLRILLEREAGGGMNPCIVDLDATLALEAARLSVAERLPLADSVMLATARVFHATLWTQDSDFEGREGVRFVRR